MVKNTSKNYPKLKPYGDLKLKWQLTHDHSINSFRIAVKLGNFSYSCIVDDPFGFDADQKLVNTASGDKMIGVLLMEHLEDLVQSGQANENAVQAYLYLRASLTNSAG